MTAQRLRDAGAFRENVDAHVQSGLTGTRAADRGLSGQSLAECAQGRRARPSTGGLVLGSGEVSVERELSGEHLLHSVEPSEDEEERSGLGWKRPLHEYPGGEWLEW